ncbi:hypothetical protein DFQ26_001924 [Actinomortierella ambigua]|nr:hypothetical protein DFQ26_001924 [Actinomortierella ambigua]
MADVFIGVAERMGLQRKIAAITTDNASNVTKMMKCIEEYTINNPDTWSPFDAKTQHIHCLAHVLNLGVQAMLGDSGIGASAPAVDVELYLDDDDNLDNLVNEPPEQTHQANELDASLDQAASDAPAASDAQVV